MTVKQVIGNLTSGQYTVSDILIALQATEEDAELLYDAADKHRKNVMGDEVHLRGLIEFTNYCRNDCLYCGLRRSNKNLKRYRLEKEEIIGAARTAEKYGYRTIVLQGGEDTYFTGSKMVEIISEIKKTVDVAITVSMGIMTADEYEMLHAAGADRYLMRHETSDCKLFSKLRPGTSFKERIAALKMLKSLGYEVGAGNMVGLPGQTVMSIAGDIMLMAELNVDMAGVGPFLPHQDTPLGKYKQGNTDIVLNELAILRLIISGVNLPATTALATINPQLQLKALNAGANVIMPNITPEPYKLYYSIYPNKKGNFEASDTNHERVMRLIADAGRTVGKGYGNKIKI